MKATSFAAFAAALAMPLVSSAAVLFSEDFDVDPTANWTVNDSGLSDILADFNYDYSAIGVPAAPGGSSTTGLRMTANNSGGVFSGFSVSPTGQSFAGNYKVEFDMWQNYVGPVGPGGSGTTQLSSFGVGTNGATAIWPGSSPKESVGFSVTLDGGSAADFRVYTSAVSTGHLDGDPVYASASRNGNDAYYTTPFPGGVSAPAAQLALFPGQTGVTDAGEIGFEWRRNVIEVLNGVATWTVDGTVLATVDTSTLTLGGGNIFFGHADTNSSSSADPNDSLLNVTLIDNVVVSEVIPEPASLGLVALGLGLAAAARRRV
ncbi:PEP-CTERM sorting domain-containing protein [Botrimarina mediterranea]|uniref:PEP-CTERM sorting domain-containing protein n=1 Tax=Botrimarina mediterranea TaxID=2528022 RepID=UPI00118B8A04|nr:hypothetical protein K2D_44330 [Planctomycetes bacterium K2D]